MNDNGSNFSQNDNFGGSESGFNPEEQAQQGEQNNNQSNSWQGANPSTPPPPYGYGYPPYGQPPFGGQGNGNPPPYGQYNYPPYGYPPYGYPQGGFYYAPSPEELQRREEKQQMKKLGNAVCVPLCLITVISSVLSVMVSTIIFILLGQKDASSLLTNPDFSYLFSALVSVLCFTVPFIITSKTMDVKWRDMMQFKKTSSTKFVAVIMLGLGICSLSNYASSFISSLLEQTTGQGAQTSMTEFGTGWMSFAISLLCVGILPALLEEFAFRGVVLGALRRYLGDGAAIFVSASLFALLHGNLQQIPFAFGVGLALGYATVYCGSIIPALVLHGLNNCLAVVMDFATRTLNPLNSQLVTMLYLAVLLLIGLCGFIILSVSDKDAFKLSTERSENSGRKVKYFSSSFGAIAYFVITALTVIAVQLG